MFQLLSLMTRDEHPDKSLIYAEKCMAFADRHAKQNVAFLVPVYQQYCQLLVENGETMRAEEAQRQFLGFCKQLGLERHVQKPKN